MEWLEEWKNDDDEDVCVVVDPTEDRNFSFCILKEYQYIHTYIRTLIYSLNGFHHYLQPNLVLSSCMDSSSTIRMLCSDTACITASISCWRYAYTHIDNTYIHTYITKHTLIHHVLNFTYLHTYIHESASMIPMQTWNASPHCSRKRTLSSFAVSSCLCKEVMISCTCTSCSATNTGFYTSSHQHC